MKYDMQWTFKTYRVGKATFKASNCRIQIKESDWIDQVFFTVESNCGVNQTTYEILIVPSRKYVEPNGHVYTNSELRFSIGLWFDNITNKVNTNLGDVGLANLTKTEFLRCTKAILNHMSFSLEDTEMLIYFAEQGIISKQPILKKMTSLVHKFKLQEAVDLATEWNKNGYPDILYSLGEILLANKHFQQAYMVFSNVPHDDSNYINAQIHAAMQAALPTIKLSTERERCRTVFKHCQNAGEQGRPCFLQFFKNIGAETMQSCLLETVDADFDTLFKFATIMSQQDSKIAQQNLEVKELKERLAPYENSKSSYDPRHFSTTNNNTSAAPGCSNDFPFGLS